MKTFLALLLIATQAWAGLPPTTVKDSNDSSGKTTFNLQFPAMAGTHTGTTYSLGVTTTPTASFFAGWDANKNLSANNFIAGYATTATSGGTTTLTATDARKQVFTGTAAQTVVLPAVSTLAKGTDFLIQNNSTGIVTVESSGGNVITTLANQQLLPFTSNATIGTGASVWDYPSILGQVAQANWYGAVDTAATASCDWTAPGTGTPANMSANASCPSSTAASGSQVIAPATKIPAAVLPSGGAGVYRFVAKGQFLSINESCKWRFSDGTNNSTTVSSAFSSTSGNSSVPMIEGEINYTTPPPANTTVQIQSSATTTGSNCELDAVNVPLEISVYYFPSQSQTAASLSNVSANWSGYQTVASGWTVTASTYTDLAAGSSIVTTANGTPHGISCVTNASSKAGIDCTLPKAGNFRIKADIVNGATGTATASYRIVDASGTVIDPGRSNAVSAGNYFPMHLEGGYTASSTSVTFKIQGATNAATASIFNGLASGSAAIQWNVEQIDAPGPQPYATGNVSSKGSGQYYHEFAGFKVTGGTTLSIANAGTGFASSPVYNSTGNYTFAAALSSCTQTPTCNVTTTYNGGTAYGGWTCGVSSKSTSSITVQCASPGVANHDQDFDIDCKCPH